MRIFVEIEEKHLDAVRRIIEGEGKAAAKNNTEGSGRKEENQAATSAGGEDYESMTSKDLYKLCCDRGISSKCKKRDKASLIKVLRENDGKAEEEPADDEWEDEGEKKPDPYAGKTARELYNMCCDRGIVVKKKLEPEEYAAKLKEDDEAGSSSGEDDDEWNI